MSREEVERKLRSIIAEHMCIDGSDIKDDSRLYEDLGADSLDVVELVMAAEEEFEIEIPDDDVDDLTTFEKTVDYLLRRTE